MLLESEFPVLEHDDSPTAVLEPSHRVTSMFDTDKMVVTFFAEAIRTMLDHGKVTKEGVVPGECPVEIYRFVDHPDVLLAPGQVGCPACAGNMDLFWAMGIRKVMFCGGAGVLDPGIWVGQVIVVDGAIRDEGFSYHYVAPSRVIRADAGVNDAIAGYLRDMGIPFTRGLTWTTDAMFRETPGMVARRRAEGAQAVEMEQAGCLAVARFRGMSYGALLYGGDDVSGERWSVRDRVSRDGVRYDLVQMCRELVGII